MNHELNLFLPLTLSPCSCYFWPGWIKCCAVFFNFPKSARCFHSQAAKASPGLTVCVRVCVSSSRLLCLWEAQTVWRVVLWERGRRRRRRLRQCSLHPGPRQERPRTERRRGDHGAPKLRRVTRPLMSAAGWSWPPEWFPHNDTLQSCTLFFF